MYVIARASVLERVREHEFVSVFVYVRERECEYM